MTSTTTAPQEARRKSFLRSRAVFAVVAIAMGGAVPVITAGPAAAACVVATQYSVSATTQKIPYSGVPIFRNGPGGTVTATKGWSGTASYTVVAGAETEVGAVLAKAKVSISASLSQTNSTTVSVSYSRAITAGKYGNVRYMSYGKRVEWKKYRTNSNCTATYISSGTIDYPSTTQGWYYWETSS